MNVLRYFIRGDAREFLQSTRSAAQSVRDLERDLDRVEGKRLVSSAGRLVERVNLDRGGPELRPVAPRAAGHGLMGGAAAAAPEIATTRSIEIKRAVEGVDRSIGDRITGLAGRALGVASSIGIAASIGVSIGRRIRDLFEEIEARLIEARMKVVQADSRRMRGEYVARGGVERDIDRAGAAGRERRAIDDAEGYDRIALIDAAVEKRRREADLAAKGARGIYESEGDSKGYQKRLNDIARMEEEIAGLLKDRRDTEAEINRSAAERAEDDARFADEWAAAEGERKEMERRRLDAEARRAAIAEELAEIEGRAIQSPDDFRRATRLRDEIAGLDDQTAAEEARRAEDVARARARNDAAAGSLAWSRLSDDEKWERLKAERGGIDAALAGETDPLKLEELRGRRIEIDREAWGIRDRREADAERERENVLAAAAAAEQRLAQISGSATRGIDLGARAEWLRDVRSGRSPDEEALAVAEEMRDLLRTIAAAEGVK